ncbi:alpha-hydroxy acid oxidase [Rhodococcus koreensis]
MNLQGIQLSWSTAKADLISVEDYRRRARRKLPDMVWAYVDGGSDDLVTLDRNTSDFSKWAFQPRVLTGKEGLGMASMLGQTPIDIPVYLSPTGISGLCHHTGEVAAALAAENAGTRAVISTAASYTPEEIARATSHDHAFQLYPWANMATGARTMTESFIQRAYDNDYQSLFVTVDVPVHGNREGERKRGMGAPPTLTPGRIANAAVRPRWWINFLRHQRITARLLLDEGGAAAAVKSAQMQLRLMRPELDWDDFAWMREKWSDRPLFIKGVLHPDDAAQAVELGADGIVVSNHGGRQLDGVQSSLDALPAIVDRVGDRVPVLLDGGVRRGSDVVKALCLGATAVGIGRPYLYGLAVDGRDGVSAILNIFKQEISRTLTMLGVADIRELNRSHLVRVDGSGPSLDSSPLAIDEATTSTSVLA